MVGVYIQPPFFKTVYKARKSRKSQPVTIIA
nr:MAG TPA: hypothetical protein [Caudoviricetes sp.]